MKNVLRLLPLLCSLIVNAQSNNNGQLDTISEFTTITTVQATMPDGTRLATDIYLPIISDSVTTEIEFDGTTYVIEIIPKGTQLFVYDSLNGMPNPNPYQLPMVFTRTPYGKGEYDEFGIYMNVLGYAYALQDMRGRYESEGVYLPMYSDSWDKSAYHPNEKHPLDVTDTDDPRNGIYHQDGRYSIDFLTDSLFRTYDLDGDGIEETTALTYNGSLAMFGASALGNTQYQAAASFPNDVSKDGLKGLVPIVATNEHFNCVLQHNGVFRQALVQGWLTGQLLDNVDEIPEDTSIDNNIHSTFDYGGIEGDSVISLAVDYITTVKDPNGYTGMYPNFAYRTDANAQYAPINALGESDPNGTHNRYENMELPMYHLTGWWDIFIDGQIDTYNHIMANTSAATQSNQKIVIGPWTHSTISSANVADITYPESVLDIQLANAEATSFSLTELVEGDLVDWYRYLLNYDDQKWIGEPKVLIPKSEVWQDIGSTQLRIPAADTYLTYAEFINYLSGFGPISGIPVEFNNDGEITPFVIDLPADSTLQAPNTKPVTHPVSEPVDFSSIPNIRYYVPGPVDDGITANANRGNYWRSSDAFPLKTGWQYHSYYLHQNQMIDTLAPETNEGSLSYEHDPDDPVYTAGGGNLAIPTPNGDRVNAGPMNYADPEFASVTMNHPGVIQFETAPIEDSLCIIGVPKAEIFASSQPLSGPDGPTDTDFFVRVLDVYPDGREFFVVEGAVNARSRAYAQQLAMGEEDVSIPYSNIEAGEVYAYSFNLLPIAYTFGQGHQVKVLISSSNWPRYQSNANVPIEAGDFFRRSPEDGRSYNYQGTTYAPRIARQNVFFNPDQPSRIMLPVFDGVSHPNEEKDPEIGDGNWLIYPNPVTDILNILTKNDGTYTIRIYDLSGNRVLAKADLSNKTTLDLSFLAKGVYVIQLEAENGDGHTEKFVKI